MFSKQSNIYKRDGFKCNKPSYFYFDNVHLFFSLSFSLLPSLSLSLSSSPTVSWAFSPAICSEGWGSLWKEEHTWQTYPHRWIKFYAQDCPRFRGETVWISHEHEKNGIQSAQKSCLEKCFNIFWPVLKVKCVLDFHILHQRAITLMRIQFHETNIGESAKKLTLR